MNELFAQCINRKRVKGGLEISCKLGNWSVVGRDTEEVERDARHYWIQYFKDGKYSKLLGNKKGAGKE